MSELTPFLQKEKRKSEDDLQRQRDWCAKLAEEPEQTIKGLVNVNGAWSSNPRSLLDHWTFLFSLDAWTDSAGVLHPEKVTVRKVVDESHLRELERVTSAESIISLRAHIGNLPGFNVRQAALVELIDSPVEDVALKQFALALSTPLMVESKLLGQLTLDRRTNWFEGVARLGTRKIRINLSPKDIADASLVIATAEELWANLRELTRRAIEFAAAELLEVKNGSWLEERESPFHSSQFTRKMKLESITVNEDGKFDFWFNDGGLFWGHSIEVSGDSQRGFFNAGFHG